MPETYGELKTLCCQLRDELAAVKAERDAAVRELRAEKNEPLTLDELRELGREPVYIVSLGEDFDDGWQLCVGVGGG